MKTRDLAKIGIPPGRCADAAKQLLQNARNANRRPEGVLDDLGRVAAAPASFVDDARYGPLARLLVDHAAAQEQFVPRSSEAPYKIWGTGLEPDAVQQLKNACQLPVAVSGALMPDGTSATGCRSAACWRRATR